MGQSFQILEIITLIYKYYLQRASIRGNRDKNFFHSINTVFVSFVAMTIQYCLKEYRTGKAPTELLEFKYQTAAGKLISDMKDESKTNQLQDYTTICIIYEAFPILKSGH